MGVVRSLCVLALLAVLSTSAADDLLSREETQNELSMKMVNPLYAFEQWVEEHSAAYVKGTKEWETRFQIWLSNLHKVADYNKKHESHWLTMNKFADMTEDEFQKQYLGVKFEHRSPKVQSTEFIYKDVDIDNIPKSMDWREKNAVTMVKNQKSCGSCWSFSTTGSIEGINAISTGELVVLSEQELVDCDTSKDKGCHGGWMDYAFEWIIKNGGITTEADYPYTAREHRCDPKKKGDKFVSIDDYQDVPSNQDSLLAALSKQPVSVAIESSQMAFQLYGGGVFDANCGTKVDHGVLAVGYNLSSTPYIIVKNSWGGSWGEHGYIRLAMNKNGDSGQCGITLYPTIPIKTTPNPPAPSPTPSPSPGPSPSPSPSPIIECNAISQCNADKESCCCQLEYFGICFIYGCCPFQNGTCCDQKHCCPGEKPSCDLDSMTCTDGTNSVPMGNVTTAALKSPLGSWVKEDTENVDTEVSSLRRQLPVT